MTFAEGEEQTLGLHHHCLRCTLSFLGRGNESDTIADPARQPGRGTSLRQAGCQLFVWWTERFVWVCRTAEKWIQATAAQPGERAFTLKRTPACLLNPAFCLFSHTCAHRPLLRHLLSPVPYSELPASWRAGDRMQLQTSPAHFNSCKCFQVCCRATVGENLAESNRQLYQAQADLHIHYSHRLWFVQCQKTAMPLLQAGHNLQSSAIVDVMITELFNSLYFLKQQLRAYPHESLCSEALSQPLFFCLSLSPSKSSLLPLQFTNVALMYIQGLFMHVQANPCR